MKDKPFKLWHFLIYAGLLLVSQTVGATLWVSKVNNELKDVKDNKVTIKVIETKQDKQDDTIKEIKVNLKQMMEKQGYKWIPVE